jgi:hypothetical protein
MTSFSGHAISYQPMSQKSPLYTVLSSFTLMPEIIHCQDKPVNKEGRLDLIIGFSIFGWLPDLAIHLAGASAISPPPNHPLDFVRSEFEFKLTPQRSTRL